MRLKKQFPTMSEEEIKNAIARKYSVFLKTANRSIPEPAELRQAVNKAVDGLKDAYSEKHGQLFSQATLDEITNFLKHVDTGCISDHPDYDLYYTNPDGDSKY